ncbi:MAG: GNAT family N-acetyltransferase [Christensenellales bacterium]
MIRLMETGDGARVLEIYGLGMKTGNATFETEVPAFEEWDAKYHSHSRLVYVENGRVCGWTALLPVSARKAFAGVAEVSVYVDPACSGRGIATQLLQAVIKSSEENGVWSIFSSIFIENTASIRVHEKCGFRMIGKREKIGMLSGVWRDTVNLERRSRVIGIEGRGE